VTEIWVSAIGALATILAVWLQSKASRKEMIHQLELQQERADASLTTSLAVTTQRMDDLTREVREHNNFARRLPVVEEQIKVINHRLSDLEHKSAS
jgi:hypothetical protein